MATVYLAVQKSLDREVALKVMSPAMAADGDFCKRFLKEGRIIAKLVHGHIVTVYDIGAHGSNYYMALEYANGGNLNERVREGMSALQTLEYLKQIASALGYAHARGFVHRDVKPANILFRADGTLLLSDFGIAKAVGSGTQLTQFGLTLGTPYYMSPEQLSGEPVLASDLYSLGIMFYEMLMGAPPYQGDSAFAIAYKHKFSPIPTLPRKYAELQPILNRLLDKKPDKRYANADELILAVEKLEARSNLFDQNSGEMVVQNPVLALDSSGKFRWGMGVLLLMSLLGGGGYWYGWLRTEPELALAAVKSPSDFVDLRIRSLDEAALASKRTLEIHAEDEEIHKDLDRIIEKYSDLARWGWLNVDPQTALRVVDRGLAVFPQQNELLKLRQEIESAEQQSDLNATDRRKVQRLLEKAAQQLADLRFTVPPGDNAVESFKKILQLEPNNQIAINRLQEMASLFEEAAKNDLSNGKMKEVAYSIEQGLMIDPKHPGLLELRNSLASSN